MMMTIAYNLFINKFLLTVINTQSPIFFICIESIA